MNFSSPLLWPRALQRGGTVGLCSPSGPCPAGSVEKAALALERRGYRVIVAPHAQACHADYLYLAGTEAQRADDLNALLNNPDVDMILCTRGGYGAGKIVDRLVYDAMRRDPKPLVGYSDITALSLAMAAQAGVVTFSGIMATGKTDIGGDETDAFSEASLWQAVGDNSSPRILRGPDNAPAWTIHRGGDAVSGPVYPVCLSLLTSLLGTPYVPDLTGAILVIEDVGEALYRVDRMLTQLRLAGILHNLTAVLIGSFNATDEDDRLRNMIPQLVLEMTPPGVAVASGVVYGHIARRFTLPVGATGTANLTQGTFTFA